jgi:hypothetical protein
MNTDIYIKLSILNNMLLFFNNLGYDADFLNSYNETSKSSYLYPTLLLKQLNH